MEGKSERHSSRGVALKLEGIALGEGNRLPTKAFDQYH